MVQSTQFRTGGDDLTQVTNTLLSTPLRAASHREPQAAGQRTYVLRQRFSYSYDAPVRDLDHRLVVVPPRRHGDQRRLLHSITVSAANARTTHRRDADGNMVTRSRVPLVPDRVEFVVDAVVERVRPGPACFCRPPRSPTRGCCARPG